MTRDDVIRVMALLKAAYPAYYRGMSKADAYSVIALWAEMFKEEDPAVVLAAVKAHIASDEKGFPPHIGAIKNAVRKVLHPDEMSEMEAWSILHRAICRSGYHSEEEFQKLPAEIQRIAGSPNQLKAWAMMDPGELGTVVQSNFLRSYRAVAQAEKERQMIPETVRHLADRMRLPAEAYRLTQGDDSRCM